MQYELQIKTMETMDKKTRRLTETINKHDKQTL
jgi:hypothetical protein